MASPPPMEGSPEDKIIRFRLGDDLGLPVSHITFPMGKKQSVMMWKHQITRKLNDKHKAGLDPNTCVLADANGQAFTDGQHLTGAELKDSILHKGQDSPGPSCSCGEPHTQEEIFCPNCGEKLKAASAAPSGFENAEIEGLQLQMETAMKEKESLKNRRQTSERWGGEDKAELDRLLDESRKKIDDLVERLIMAKNALADEMLGPAPVKKVEEPKMEEKKLTKAEQEQQKKAALAEKKENDKRLAEQKAAEKKENERKERERKDLEKKQAADKAAALKNAKHSTAPKPIISSSPPPPEAPGEPPLAPDPPSAPEPPSAPGPPPAPSAPAGPVAGPGYGRPTGAPANRGNLLDQIAAGKKLKKAVTVEKSGDVVGAVAGASKAKPAVAKAAEPKAVAKLDPKAAAKAEKERAEQAKKDKALADKNEAARKKEAEQKSAADKAAALKNSKSKTQPIPPPTNPSFSAPAAPPSAPEAPPEAPGAPPDAPGAPPDAPGAPPDAPGAPPGAPPGPPDPPGGSKGYGRPAAGAGRGALLDQIAAGQRLKKVVTVEKTGDQVGSVAGKGGGSAGGAARGGGASNRAASPGPKPAAEGPMGDLGAIAAAKFAARQAKGAPVDPAKDRPKVAAANEGVIKVALRKTGEDDGKAKAAQPSKSVPTPDKKPSPVTAPTIKTPAPMPAPKTKVPSCPKCGKPKGIGRFCEDCGTKY